MTPVPLPTRTIDEVIAAVPYYRQSLLGTMDNCALAARFDLEGYQYTNAAQARGIIFHSFAAKLLRTLQATGEVRVPTQEAMEILYEACRQADVADDDVVVLSQRERRYLRICALSLAREDFTDVHRLIAVERRLFATVTYDGPDGRPVQRQISGQPDALLADPPDGAIVPDWKTARAAPAKYTRGRDPSEDEGGDPAHVSFEGYWQQRFYGLLVMDNYPSVQHTTLRECYPGAAKEDDRMAVREATVTRAALEHVRREIADVVAFLDRAMVAGHDSPLWAPSPGAHCSFCRRPTACPIEPEARIMEMGVGSQAQAARAAGQFVVADNARDKLRKALKARYEATGEPIPVRTAKGRLELRKDGPEGKTGSFGLFPPAPDPVVADPALDAAFAEAAAR